MSNNPPYKVVALTKEQYDFVMENINTNMAFGLAALPTLQGRDSMVKMVELLEKFKGLKKAMEAAE